MLYVKEHRTCKEWKRLAAVWSGSKQLVFVSATRSCSTTSLLPYFFAVSINRSLLPILATELHRDELRTPLNPSAHQSPPASISQPPHPTHFLITKRLLFFQKRLALRDYFQTMALKAFLATAISAACLVTAQFPPKPEGVKELKSKIHSGVRVSYKEPGLCETTPGVKSYAGECITFHRYWLVHLVKRRYHAAQDMKIGLTALQVMSIFLHML